MPIRNILDGRERPFRYLKVNAVIEPSWHDNAMEDADQSAVPGRDGPEIDWRQGYTVTQAIAWANAYPAPMTLYLYDEDRPLDEVHERRMYRRA